MSNGNEEKSFWRTLPGILTGTAAIITAITGLLIALNAAGIITIPPIFPTPTPTPTPTSTPTSQSLPSGISPIPTAAKTILPSTPVPTSIPSSTSAKIFAACFPEVPENRTKAIEAGTKEFVLVNSSELSSPQDEPPMVLKITELGDTIGYIKLLIFKDNYVNKIEKVVDPNCQIIEEYSNFNDPKKDKHVLGGFWASETESPVKIKFGNYYYKLNVYFTDFYQGYPSKRHIGADFERIVQ